MDLLYRRYSNPLQLMNMYINNGRFGEFVSSVIDAENKRIYEEMDKENENKLFQMYVHTIYLNPDKSFEAWKNEVLNNTNETESRKSNSLSMTNAEIEEAKNKSRDILNRFKIK